MHSTHMANSDEQDTEADSDGVSQSIHRSLSAPPNMSSESWKRVVAKAHAIVADSPSMSAVPGGNVRSRFVVSSRHPDSPQKVLAGNLLDSTHVTRRSVQCLLVIISVVMSWLLPFIMEILKLFSRGAVTLRSMKARSSLVPRPPPFFVLRFAFSIIYGSGRVRKMGKAWECGVGGGGGGVVVVPD